MPNGPQPPTAQIRPHTITQHGQTRTDNYFWLRERADPEVRQYLEAENAYTWDMLAHTKDLQEQLFIEMKGRIQETDLSVPEKRGDYYYYSRQETGKQYPIYCRKRGSLDGTEEVILDQNTLAEGQTFCNIGMFRVSPNQEWLAYSVDFTGAEYFTLRFKNLATGETLAEEIPNTYYALEWANDNRTVFYSVLDPASRPYKLFRHVVGSAPARDTLIHHETDESYFIWLMRANSGGYLFMVLRSTLTTEVHYLPADFPLADFKVLQPRRHKVEYYVYHHGDRFLIHTNEDAQNFKLLTAPIGDPRRENWREFLPHRSGALLQSLEVFERHLVRFEREGGLQQIRVSDIDGGNERSVEFPEPVYSYEIDPNVHREFSGDVLRFTYNSLISPKSVIDYGLADRSWTLKKQDQIPSGYDLTLYETKRLMATARDGVQVPLSIVYKKGLQLNGRNPTLLYGYGSYGACVDPYFNPNRLSLLERGFVFAIAHIRGGSELGRAWYDAGRLLHKKNSFTDFIDCAEHLIALGYTAPDRLACQGVSAGGLLMGAVVTLRPDLFKACIALVPFVDVVNTISDPSIPLTVIEWEQWGNPADRAEFDYMLSYSPYDHVTAKVYPNLLITAGLNDPRVAYWEPAKWTAKLRAIKTGDNWLLLKTNMAAGHAGSSGRYDYLREIAVQFAFLLDRLGVN